MANECPICGEPAQSIHALVAAEGARREQHRCAQCILDEIDAEPIEREVDDIVDRAFEERLRDGFCMINLDQGQGRQNR